MNAPSALIPLFNNTGRTNVVLDGINLDTLLSRSMIDPRATHISEQQRILLMLTSIEMRGDEGHGLGRHTLGYGFASLALRSMLSTTSLGAALAVLSRYFETCSNCFRLSIRGDIPDVTRVSLIAYGPHGERSEELEGIWLNAIYMFLSWFVGREISSSAKPDQFDARPVEPSVHWAVPTIQMKGARDGIYVPRECLNWRRNVDRVEEPLWEALRFWIDRSGVSAPPPLGRFFDNAEAPAAARLKDVPTTREFGVRQLRRVVKQRFGSNYRGLRADALVEQASQLLREDGLTIEVIAARLGYSEERSFRRFICNHTGQTPSQLRKDLRARIIPAHDPLRSRIHELTRKMET